MRKLSPPASKPSPSEEDIRSFNWLQEQSTAALSECLALKDKLIERKNNILLEIEQIDQDIRSIETTNRILQERRTTGDD